MNRVLRENWSSRTPSFRHYCETKQNTLLELSGQIQELQNEINCMNDSKDFQDAESIRSGNSPRYQWTSVIPTSSDT